MIGKKFGNSPEMITKTCNNFFPSQKRIQIKILDISDLQKFQASQTKIFFVWKFTSGKRSYVSRPIIEMLIIHMGCLHFVYD